MQRRSILIYWDAYLTRIEYTYDDISRLDFAQPDLYISLTKIKYGSTLCEPIWGRPEVEGPLICKIYNIQINIIEKYNVDEVAIWINQIVDDRI